MKTKGSIVVIMGQPTGGMLAIPLVSTTLRLFKSMKEYKAYKIVFIRVYKSRNRIELGQNDYLGSEKTVQILIESRKNMDPGL